LLKNFCGAALFLSCTLTGFAQVTATTATAQEATTSIFIARSGEQLELPRTLTYHFLEFLQMRGKWINPDVGNIDYAHGNYREVFGGAGAAIHHGKRFTLIEELYFDQAL
jgi:hypothetical protein